MIQMLDEELANLFAGVFGFCYIHLFRLFFPFLSVCLVGNFTLPLKHHPDITALADWV